MAQNSNRDSSNSKIVKLSDGFDEDMFKFLLSIDETEDESKFLDNGEPIKAYRCVECGMIVTLENREYDWGAVKELVKHFIETGKKNHYFEPVKHWKNLDSAKNAESSK